MTTVCIPYRGATVDRRVAYRAVTEWWQEHFPSLKIITADSDHDPFSRAGSRNEAVRQAPAGPVIICDADTIPDPVAVEMALDSDLGVINHPFTRFMSLTREGTLAACFLGDGWAAHKPEFVTTWSVGGCVIMDRAAYFDAGGQDERFIGWGGEDVAFHLACDALLGKSIRHPGVAYGMWHPSDVKRGSRADREMRKRQDLYRAAKGKPDRMRELIKP